MNPGIFYLYEYSHSQKLRNAGFLKISRYYHSCTLQINARGIPVTYAEAVKLYVFYLENNLAEATVLTEISCANHALSARMTSAESLFPGGRTLDKVDGFFLLLPNGHILVAAAPGIAVDPKKLLSASKGSAAPEMVPDNTEAMTETPEGDTPGEAEAGIPGEAGEHGVSGEADGHGISSEADEHGISSEADEHGISGEAVEHRISGEAAEETSADKKDFSNTGPSTTVEAETVPEYKVDELSIPSPSYEEGENYAVQTPSAKYGSPDVPGFSERSDSSAASDLPMSESAEEAISSPATDPTAPGSAISDSPASGSALSDSPAPGSALSDSPAPGSTEEDASSPATDASPKQVSPSRQETPQQNIRKIQRSELSILPRRYWHLANNSFLLHGYHNYNHLILIEKDGHYWLGVPGIYDPREARAARLFGFPQFTDSYNKFLQLSEEECNPHGNFGYWCCYLK